MATHDHPVSGRPQNHSGYAHHVAINPTDYDKWQTMPHGVYECEGYREKTRQTDHEVTRTYFVPWSVLHWFREWALGYPVLVTPTPQVVQEEDGFWSVVGDWRSQVDGIGRTILKRVLPVQDPYRPWLFASDVECIETMGAVVPDRGARAQDSSGATIKPEIVLPSIAVVDNSLGGAVASGNHQPDAGQTGYETTELPAGQGTNFWLADLFTGDAGEQLRKYTPPSLSYGDGGTKCRVTFRPRPFEVLTDTQADTVSRANKAPKELTRYVMREEQYAIEAIPLARVTAQTLKFAESPTGTTLQGTEIPEAGVLQLPSAQLTYTWHEVPERPLSAYARCLGKVNAAEFDGLGGSPKYPAESLLCMPWQTKRRVSCTGRVTWDITYRFSFRPHLWNRFPYAATTSTGSVVSGFALATFGGRPAADRVYKSANFDDLFVLATPTDYLGTNS